MNNVLDLIKKVGEKESSITSMEFVSPIFHNTEVATQVYGIIYKFRIPETKPGWYTIRPNDFKTASVIGEAPLTSIDRYRNALSKIRVTLALKKGDFYLGVADKTSPLKGAIPVFLFDDSVQDFDRVLCRFDGVNLWYDGPDPANDPAKADYLRNAILQLTNPEKIRFHGLLFDEKAAYAFRTSIDIKLKEELKKKGIQADVEHAGGKFVKLVERSDHISVTYRVDGEKFTSYVSKDPSHKIITAGICLAGGDALFDLKSLITVLREGQRRNLIHRFNNTR